MSKEKSSEILFNKYEFLASKYASRIYSYEQLSFEYDDLVQEFRIKIFTSIKAYGRRYLKYKRGEAVKPVPLRYYLEAACGNKMRDFMKYISRENNKMSIDAVNYDYGVESESKIIPEKNIFIVKGVDLLEGLSGKERAIFSLYLKGYKKNLLNKVYYSTKEEKNKQKEVINNGDSPLTITDIIEIQKRKIIKKYGNDLLSSNRVFKTLCYTDD